jgi:hypothetical protein
MPLFRCNGCPNMCTLIFRVYPKDVKVNLGVPEACPIVQKESDCSHWTRVTYPESNEYTRWVKHGTPR